MYNITNDKYKGEKMKPRIFVSSTFYDLKYIREDLSNFIKGYDFEAIMFEDGDVGYTPGKYLDESCYDAMRTADMVVLIIGGYYGSAASGDKEGIEEYMSVTRNEFKTAIANGIPVYAFIDTSVYSEYGIYEANMHKLENNEIELNFLATKNINIFRFIKFVKTLSKIPITEFKKSADIKDFLSKQWADMFKNYLRLLQDNKKIEQLHGTMSDMQSLVEKMELMLNGLGKKVLSVDHDGKQQLNAIIMEQELIDACNFISKNLDFSNEVGSLSNADKKLIIVKLLDLLSEIDLDECDRLFKSNNEEDDNTVFLLFSNNDLELEGITEDFFEEFINIQELLKETKARNFIEKKLMDKDYFNRMFGGKNKHLSIS